MTSADASPEVRIRPATLADLDALVDIETRSFAADRVSRRSFRRFLARPSAAVLVAEAADRVAGYALVLFRRGSALARLYSLAVRAEARATGLGRRLLSAAEAAAAGRGCRWLRLEVRPDNTSAISLYRSLGYVCFGRIAGFYADRSEALRMCKPLPAGSEPAA